ncbi:DNA phosphorothioation-dependent restriction protein DptF [Thalassomonas haliotis]|uniref:DNA phosphorothioation-dependent restriction protein DptF n=1 Tax=Thalassomonas haliotis TaxID=485448 RepID=A0ABY7VIC5_9GAMM|nr:DNA phosphorothioation-dependent restriction protein DptF [Thalassomonas haliotis]WDE13484.1 DNA phosphorothioation-dependent restriction protein DptF [Thalassomonas haliotis]
MQTSLSLKEALSVLSKSSPYAVSTERKESMSAGLDVIKSYLYIETDIEKDFYKELSKLSANDKKIIFLCGSSGDGKSEILTKYNHQFSNRVDFHFDATHSFKPQDSAIQTLDKVFTDFNAGNKPLVVGINIGMLGNYAEEGDNIEIKESIKAFLDSEKFPDNHIYLNFEDYPKFELQQSGHSSKFAKRLLQRITAEDGNIIRQYFDKELTLDKPDKRLCANYALLSIEAIQDVIVDLLFKARLIKDQFLTVRALLDFIFHLLAGPGYLQDNLFDHCDNELVSKITEFDPANIRSQLIDKFVLALSLKLPDSDFDDFVTELSKIGIRRGQKAVSYLRLFYLLRKTEFSNNYHQAYKDDFHEQLIDKYSTVWHLHTAYEGSPTKRTAIKTFYKEIVIAAIHKYNNRNAPNLNKGEFFICERNGYQLAAKIDLKIDLKTIENHVNPERCDVSHFKLFFKIGNENKSQNIPANINLLYLMQRIVDGYRPNKHDKNTVVILDEIVQMIADVASKSSTLHVLKGEQRLQVTNVDNENEDYEVSGL